MKSPSIKVRRSQELGALSLIIVCQAEEMGSMCWACQQTIFIPCCHLSCQFEAFGWKKKGDDTVSDSCFSFDRDTVRFCKDVDSSACAGQAWVYESLMERGARKTSGSFKKASISRTSSGSQKVRVVNMLIWSWFGGEPVFNRCQWQGLARSGRFSGMFTV